MSDKNVLVQLQNVTKSYEMGSAAVEVLKDINLTVKARDFISISGPSGSGKSTLLAIVGLLDQSFVGNYYFLGKNIQGMSVNEQAKLRNSGLGFIFQSFNLIDTMSVFDNVALPLRYISQRMSETTLTESVMKALEKVGLNHLVSHYPKQLSGGQQQRVAIARAVVNKPKLLLVDEPTGNLDSKSGEQIMNMLVNLNLEGVAICLVSHDKRFSEFAKQRYRLADGSLLN